LPIRSHSVDAVLSLGVVEHDESGPQVALAETRRILKPGGLLVLSVPYDNLWRRLIGNHLQTFVTWRRRRAAMRLGFVEYRFTAREVCQFLEQAGFTVVSTFANDFKPPRTVGLWVDYQNLTFDPFAPLTRAQLFLLPPSLRRIGVAVLRWCPWFVAGEVAVLARPR
jgi:SAM-dependent methyltransferase